MAFGGSQSSATLPHTHNQTLVNDGGQLSQTLTDMNGVTLYSLITGLDSGALEYLGEHTNVAEEYDFTWTPTIPIDFNNYSAIICYYSYSMDATGSSFDLRMLINNDSTANYMENGTTQSGTTVTGIQNISAAYFTLSDATQNVGNSTQISGSFIIQQQDDKYQFIKYWSDSWSRTTRNVLGHKAEIQSTITTLDFDSSVGTPAGWINGKWQFYGMRK